MELPCLVFEPAWAGALHAAVLYLIGGLAGSCPTTVDPRLASHGGVGTVVDGAFRAQGGRAAHPATFDVSWAAAFPACFASQTPAAPQSNGARSQGLFCNTGYW